MIQVEGFNIRIVQQGETYGRFGDIVHDDVNALVEFYDSSADRERFGFRGQFVSRYYIYTLMGCTAGLQLDGGIPAWAISDIGMTHIKRYLRGFLMEQASAITASA